MSRRWKNFVLRQTKLVKNVNESRNIVSDIINNEYAIGFDCEGVGLGAGGEITLMQISDSSGQAFIFDVYTHPELIFAGGLKRLLEDDEIVKVIHDCRNDRANLVSQFGIYIENIFDTQRVFTSLQSQWTGTPKNKIPRISLNGLFMHYGLEANALKDIIKNEYPFDQAFWARRPLSKDMLVYAAYDVMNLVSPVYEYMLEDLEEN